MRKIYLHPSFIVLAIWSLVYYLYNLGWSELISIPIEDANLFLIVLFATFLSCTLLFYFSEFATKKFDDQDSPKYSTKSDISLPINISKWYFFWCIITIIEIFFSGGVPLGWAITGSSKTYFDFGIPSLHGLANGLISALSLTSFLIFLKSNNSKYLAISLLIIPWGVIAVSRQIVIVNIIQFSVLYFAIRPPNAIVIVRSFIILVFLLLGFGWLGDARTGADKFIGLAMPTQDYPDFLPSGVLWVYMYAVTPFMNLLNTINNNCGCESYFFANTISPLLPSILRNIIIDTSIIEKGDVVSLAFNVSTAFIDSYLDAGYFGIFVFAALISSASHYYWRRIDIKGVLVYGVLAQSLILTIFYNHFFSLPVISQVFWIYLLFKASPYETDIKSTSSH
jgi:oligosaccharide repeat unit polymerase